MTFVYISGSLEKSGQGSCGALTLRGYCHDPQCTGACWTYFPQPWTRCIDPGSILVEQHTMLDEATKVGMQNTDAHICVPSHLVHKLVYISNQYWEFPPVWKSTKMSQNPSPFSRSHSEFSALDALFPSVSNLSSNLTLTPLLIICRPQ